MCGQPTQEQEDTNVRPKWLEDLPKRNEVVPVYGASIRRFGHYSADTIFMNLKH